ncbi:EAL domain-containing protein [Peribacillus frigoritolerans]|uniref:EAL domain-containing protein n=1 Tax=Peribacillus frigoritolerans TaxID=450367 RepID=UPI0025710734|nr:EAL domain-containing protein [Peribacillus frigoritolerans]
MEACSFCYQSFNVYETGFLTLRTADASDELIRMGFYLSAERFARFPYSSKNQLKEILVKVNLLFTGRQLDAAIHKVKDPAPYHYHSLQVIYQHVINEETVSLIQTGAFVSHLQPILHAQSGELYGYESLLRSADHEISPYHLFQTAQKTNMQSVLDKKAREAAIRARVSQVPDGIKSFINFLPSTIYNPEYCLKHTFDIVKKYDVLPEDLVFEVVETEKIGDMNHLKNILDTYRKNGMKVALDDLGAGFATLEILRELHPDFVKIDRNYISDCHENLEKQDFLANVINLGRKLDIQVLGEGVEKEEEFEFLKGLGIDFVQGYLFGKPALKPSVHLVRAI